MSRVSGRSLRGAARKMVEILEQDGTDGGQDAETDWRGVTNPNALDRRMLQDCSASYTFCDENSGNCCTFRTCPRHARYLPGAKAAKVRRWQPCCSNCGFYGANQHMLDPGRLLHTGTIVSTRPLFLPEIPEIPHERVQRQGIV